MAEKAEVLRKTKFMLRSVLLSAPRGVVARRLQAEYRSLTGNVIPFKEFGYSTLEDFLTSIPDVISSGIGATGEVTYFGKADQSTRHIAEMVAKQKKGKVKRMAAPPPRNMHSLSQRRFFTHEPASRAVRTYHPPVSHYTPKRPVMEVTSVVSRSANFDIMNSIQGRGNVPSKLANEVNTAHRSVNFDALVCNLQVPRTKMFAARGFVQGVPQCKTRTSHSGSAQEYVTLLLKERLGKGSTLLCLFVEPHWDVKKNISAINQLKEPQGVIVYGYPEVINTPKFHKQPQSVALLVACFELERGASSAAASPGQTTLVDRPSSSQPLGRKTVPPPLNMKGVGSPGMYTRSTSVFKEGLVLSEISSQPSPTPTLTGDQMDRARKLEKEIYELIKTSTSGMWWARVSKLYHEAHHRSLTQEDMDFVLNMTMVQLDSVVPTNPMVYPVIGKPSSKAVPSQPSPSPASSASATARAATNVATVKFEQTRDLPPQQKLEIGDCHRMVLTHVASSQQFCGYLASRFGGVEKLTHELHSIYSSSSTCLKPPDSLEVGCYYACQFSADNLWYRAKLMSCDKEGLRVLYVDFGNDEQVSQNQLRQLHPDLSKEPACAVLMRLSECSDESTATVRLVELLDKAVEALFLSSQDAEQSGFEVELKDGPLEKILAAPPPFPGHVELPKNEMFSCTLSHILTPGSFYIQRNDSRLAHALMSMEEEMPVDIERRNTSSALVDVELNSLVAHKSKEEDGSLYWYRAKVLSLELDQKVEIKLVDFGNIEVVPLSSLYRLPHKYYSLPQQAAHCCLRGLSDFLETPKFYEKFMAYQESELTAKVMDSPGTRIALELFDIAGLENGSINMQLMTLGTHISKMLPTLPEVGGRASVNVTDVSSGGVVSVQVHGPSMRHLEDLMQQINARYSEKPSAADYIQDAQVDLLCCAKHNNQWYRVQLVAVSPGNKFVVELIDSGKKAELECRNLRKALDTTLFSLPPQAVRCELANVPPSGGQWTEEAAAAVYSIIGLHHTEVTVVSLSGSLPVVNMVFKDEQKAEEEDEGQDLSSMLNYHPELFGLPSLEKEQPSVESLHGPVSNDNFDEFTFDTGGEEEEEGSKPQPKQQDEDPGLAVQREPPPETEQASSHVGQVEAEDRVEHSSVCEAVLSGMVKNTFETLYVPCLKSLELKNVTVIRAESPSNFWVRPCTSVVEIFQQVLAYHCSRAAQTVPVPNEVFGVQLHPKQWTRIRCLATGPILIELIDQGGIYQLSEDAKCVDLPPVLASVPGLALRAILWGIEPVEETGWSENAVSVFSKLVEGHRMWAFLAGVKTVVATGDAFNLIELVLTETSEDIVLSDKMVSLGFARPV